MYTGLKGVPIYLLDGPGIYHIATWALWESITPRPLSLTVTR